MADWTFSTSRDEHLDEHNQFDHTDLASLTEGRVLGVVGGIIKQAASLDILARVGVKKNGSLVGSRRGINFVEGANITLAISDDVGNEEVDVTITGAAVLAALLTVNTTLTATHSTVVVNSSGASRTITLPAISTVPGIAYLIKRAGTNSVIVNRSGTDQLWTDGATATSKTLASDGAQLGIVGLSGVWYVVAERGTIT